MATVIFILKFLGFLILIFLAGRVISHLTKLDSFYEKMLNRKADLSDKSKE